MPSTSNPDCHSSEDASLALLEEVRDYLLRLPAVPMTYALARRVDAHVTQHRLKPAEHEATWQGGITTSTGVPMLQVRLHGRTLRLTPGPLSGAQDEHRLLSALSGGVSITLNRLLQGSP